MKAISKTLPTIILAVLFTLLLIYYKLETPAFVVILFFMLFAIVISYIKSKEDPDFNKKMFALDKIPKRDIVYDYIRVFAMLLAIIVHQVMVQLSRIDVANIVIDPKKRFVFCAVYAFGLSCNVLFIMLIGALSGTYKNESISFFYSKRLSHLIFPMIVYYLFYSWQNKMYVGVEFSSYLKVVFTNLLSAKIGEAPHYWIFYAILSMNVMMPYFRNMFKNMDYKTLTGMATAAYFFMFLFIMTPFATNMVISGWTGVIVYGYWVSRPETEKYYNKLLILAVIGLICMLILISMDEEYIITYYSNCSPVVCAISLGIFAFVYKHKSLFSKDFWILRLLSKYSFSILLIHWWVLHWITLQEFGIDSLAYNGLGLLVATLVTLIISLITGICIDNLILSPIYFCYNKIASGISSIVTPKQP